MSLEEKTTNSEASNLEDRASSEDVGFGEKFIDGLREIIYNKDWVEEDNQKSTYAATSQTVQNNYSSN